VHFLFHPPILAATGDTLVRDLAVVLLAAAIAGWVLHRFRLSTIPGYLIAGVAIGPSLLGWVADPAGIEEVGHVALVLLMFVIGLHLELPAGRGGVFRPIAVGAVSTIGTGLIVTGGVGLLGVGWPEAVAIGMAASMSSTAVVMKMLAQRRETNQSVGRLALGILLTQDMLVIAMLAAIPAVAIWAGVAPGSTEDGGGGMTPAGFLIAGGGLILVVLAARWGLPRALRLAAARTDSELLLVFSGSAALGAGVLTAQIGFSAELGAFIAGFVLSPTPFRHQVAAQLSPIRDLLLAIFFVWVGLGLDLAALGPAWWMVVPALAVLFVIKLGSIAGSAAAFGVSGPLSLRAGATLGQAGEFSLVVLAAGVSAGLVGERNAAIFIAVTTLSLMLTPGMARLGLQLALQTRNLRVYRDEDDDAEPASESANETGLTDHVIIAGFGPVGRALRRQLDLRDVPTVIVDLNPETVRTQRANGNAAVFGDITNAPVLEEAGIHQARAVALTVPDDEAMLKACRAIRAVRRDVLITVRAGVMSSGLRAREAGADLVTVAEIATAEVMARDVADRVSRPGNEPASP